MIVAAVAAFAIASSKFAANTTLPKTTVYNKCGGANISPEVHWSGAPGGTRSFALLVFDGNATGGWYHWVAYNLPSPVTQFHSGVRLPLGELGANSFGQLGYGGPCPPPGKVHHYIFTVYALNVARLGRAGMTGPRALAAMRGHILAKASVTGLYRR